MAANNPWGLNSGGDRFGSESGSAVRPPAQQVQPAPTFSTMQKQGVARPPAPAARPMTQQMFGVPQAGAPRQMAPMMIADNVPGMRPGGQTITSTANNIPPGATSSSSPFNLEAILRNRFLSSPNAPRYNQGSVPMQQALERLFGESLANPSRYDSDQAVATFDRLNSRLLEGADLERTKTREEMARRGLMDSTVHGGRLGDIEIQTARAQSDLASQIAEEQARTFGNDRAQAIAQAMGYGQFMTGLGQQDFLNDLATFNANQGVNQQNFQNLTGFGQQQFNNQVTTANLNNQYQQQQLELLLQLFGMV